MRTADNQRAKRADWGRAIRRMPLMGVASTQGVSSVDRLREIGLFGGLGDDVLQELSASLAELSFDPGATVLAEGETGRELYVLLDGEAEVIRRASADHATRIAVLGPGDWFGEMSILDLMPRSATVRVISAARVLRLTAHDLDLLYRRDLKSYALVVLNLAREISRRLRIADGLLAEHCPPVSKRDSAPRRTY